MSGKGSAPRPFSVSDEEYKKIHAKQIADARLKRKQQSN